MSINENDQGKTTNPPPVEAPSVQENIIDSRTHTEISAPAHGNTSSSDEGADTAEEETKQCGYMYSNGYQCRCYKLHSSAFCFNHDQSPQISEIRTIARKHGGEVRKVLYGGLELGNFRLKRIRDARNYLTWVMKQTQEGKFDPKQANSLIYGIQVFMRGLEIERKEYEFRKQLERENAYKRVRVFYGADKVV